MLFNRAKTAGPQVSAAYEKHVGSQFKDFTSSKETLISMD